MPSARDRYFVERKAKQELSIKSDPRQLVDVVRRLQSRLKMVMSKSNAPIQHASIDFMRNILRRRDSYE